MEVLGLVAAREGGAGGLPGKQLDASATLKEMAISPKMLAVLQKVDAAREEFFAGLRESARRDADAKARAKTLAKTRRRKPTVTDQE
jgi:hypothetical protein